jgi:phospholipid/cholesterol/gamma-HCH transport system substrate-binding protein
MMATLQSSNKNLLDITNNIKAITEKIKAGEGTVGRLLNDPAMANSLQATLHDFETIAAKGERTISNLEEFTERINSQNSSINKLFADTLLFDSVKSSITQLRSIAQTANDFATNLDSFAANLKTASQNLRDTNNTAGMLLNDKQIAEDLQTVIKNLKSASLKLNDDLEAAQHNFLLRGYFKKTSKNTPSTDSIK